MPTPRIADLQIQIHEWLPALANPERSPVVCLPSTGLSGTQWRKLAKQLAERGHRVLAPDLIGYGESQAWPSDRVFETRHDIAVVDATIDLCAGPVHMVAHSYGGRVGLAAATNRPELLRSIALFEPTCFGVLRSTGDDDALRELIDQDSDQRFLDDHFGGSEAWIERFVDYWSGQGTWAEFSPEERAAWLRSGRKMFEEVRETALDEVPHQRYVERLGAIPMLVMSGAESTRAGRRCAAVLGEVMPKCRHVELAEVGHMAPLLAAREVNGLILDHITVLESGGQETSLAN
ncbi:alpha/beta fold hydrolase [Nannocystaceae bacterium ST9]